jgi:hypothetical protein
MLELFCLRLACGLAGMLLLFSPGQVNPRFYRAHFLTILGLTCVSAVTAPGDAPLRAWTLLALGGAAVLAFVGSLSWSLERAPAGRLLAVLTALSLLGALALLSGASASNAEFAWRFGNDVSSAALLGAATTAMLIGHSYLIAPSMSLRPLFWSVGTVAIMSVVRAALAGVVLWSWGRTHSLMTIDDVTLLLPLRWGLGIVGPLILGVMAWQTARIRSTQSATGILYVVVIFVFLGEVISQDLFNITTGRLF